MKMGPIEKIATDKAPAAIGAYSQGIRKGMPAAWIIYTSGQIGLDPATGEFAGEDVESQTRQAMENLKAVLEEAGSGLDQAVKVTIYMSDINNFGKINAIYESYMQEPYPARSAVQVAGLPKGALVEIEAEAFA